MPLPRKLFPGARKDAVVFKFHLLLLWRQKQLSQHQLKRDVSPNSLEVGYPASSRNRGHTPPGMVGTWRRV